MSRLYDMYPKIIKSITDELKEGKAEKVWIKKFLEDNKIKRTIRINECFYRKVYEGLSNTTPDLKEETHHQAHEGMVEIIIAGCIHKSSFDATHEFFTGEGKNKKDTVDFKVEGKENTYLIEIRSTRESKRSQETNKIYELTDLSDKSISETINSDNICIDREPYARIRRLQLQILEKCTRSADEGEDVIPHKFPTKDISKAKHIVVCMPFDGEPLDEGSFRDILYSDYSYALGNQANARGIFHKDREDQASKIFQERIDCVIFIKYNMSDPENNLNASSETNIFAKIYSKHRLEVYIGYNPQYFKVEDSMKELEAMIATYFGSTIYRIRYHSYNCVKLESLSKK
jgi:hypothetical protein